MPAVAQPVPAQSQNKCFSRCGGLLPLCSLLARVRRHSGRAHLELWAWPGRWQGNRWHLVPGRGTSPSVPSPRRCGSTHPSCSFGPGGQGAATCTPCPCCPGVGQRCGTGRQGVGVAAPKMLHKGGSPVRPRCRASTRGQPASVPPQMF